MLEGGLREERYPNLEEVDYLSFSDNRENQLKDNIEDNIKDKGKVNALRWEVYKKYKGFC